MIKLSGRELGQTNPSSIKTPVIIADEFILAEIGTLTNKLIFFMQSNIVKPVTTSQKSTGDKHKIQQLQKLQYLLEFIHTMKITNPIYTYMSTDKFKAVKEFIVLL